mmetsp:Transcript_9876/g.13751  ORF Transcript_9876/g.13751 Transcript_9876/m.13751 type:complete len:185 (+) Transcript_9876:77-631(+)|eukprot:CAMPEP_0184487456 /NCGR_PEP_ID=MMETSP0113_2-20130426/10125_1 /TAXON_ID=91329 /ORGANISM="Norrisiella sphaerica, Strain BC52" /LENGTH=184 /DNA_ID=CAMNT_0026869781 /DNA_START=61 /DNA_END=615 /DNA_ORIENTATION=-
MSDGKEEQKNAAEEVNGLDEEVKDEMITLKSKDGKTIEVNKKYAFISQVIKTSLENDPDTKESLPIMGVNMETLEHIVKYMNHHKGSEPPIVEKPLRNKKMSENVKDKWDAPFIDGIADKSKQALYDLILAANYMDIKALLHLGCAKVASLIKGQPLERIREILDPKNKAEKKEDSKEAKNDKA